MICCAVFDTTNPPSWNHRASNENTTPLLSHLDLHIDFEKVITAVTVQIAQHFHLFISKNLKTFITALYTITIFTHSSNNYYFIYAFFKVLALIRCKEIVYTNYITIKVIDSIIDFI